MSHQQGGGPFGPYPQQGGWAPQHPYQSPFPQAPFPQPPTPRRRGRRNLVAAVAVLGLLIGGGAALVWGVTATGGESNDAAITKAVDAYTLAIARGDLTALRDATCDADTEQFGEYGAQSGVATLRPTPTVKNIRVKGDDAEVTISTRTAPDTRIYFRRQNDAWEACPSAVASFPEKSS